MQKIKIEKVAYGGKGIGRLDGKVYFVENALPGETVEIEVVQEKKSFTEAMAKKILEPSPYREKPICEYFGSCGGCQYQHVAYSEELKWKEVQVKEHLGRQLKLANDVFLPIVGSEQPYSNRNHVTLHPVPPFGWGFVTDDNDTLVEIKHCDIAHPKLQSVLATESSGPRAITFHVDSKGEIISSCDMRFFAVTIGTTEIISHSRCFFQNNFHITQKIANVLLSIFAQHNPAEFWDLYAGVGTFTLLTASALKDKLIVCVEKNSPAVEALKKNLEFHALAADIWEDAVEDVIFKIVKGRTGDSAFALLDPPRAGLDPVVIHALTSKKGPEHLAYLSCHLGALARDLKALTEKAYRIVSVQAFDMFPRTKHIETLVFLTRTKTED